MIGYVTITPNLKIGIFAAINIGLTVTDFNQILFELGIPENPTKKEKKIVAAVKIYIERLNTGR